MQTAQPLATDALRVEPLDSALGAEISGIDLSKSLDAVTSVALQDAFRTYRLLLIRDPNVTPESQAAFARVFGDIQIRQDYDVGLSKDFDTQYVSNERDDGMLGLGELEFHCDQLFQDDPLKAADPLRDRDSGERQRDEFLRHGEGLRQLAGRPETTARGQILHAPLRLQGRLCRFPRPENRHARIAARSRQ